jgi:hypothetical protein
MILCLPLIFATPLKNTVIYGNPFYPIKITIAGQELNHKVEQYKDIPDGLEKYSAPQRWIYSILEMKRISYYAPWSIDQWSRESSSNRVGGFFGANVVFNLLLFSYICYRLRSQDTKVALIIMVIMSAVASIMPQSHELRYYMYWMITLVSLNLYLVCNLEQFSEGVIPRWLNYKLFGVVCLLILTIVVVMTRAVAIRPKFLTLAGFIEKNVKSSILEKIEPGDQVCLMKKQPYTFFYSSRFHPEINYDYSIKAAYTSD